MILSLFPGIGLLDRGFEEEGFCVVRGPDLIFGGRIETFHPPPGQFAGVIGGSPCQDFSAARRAEATGEGVRLMREFARVVTEARPEWWLLENVPRAPTLRVEPFTTQRLDVDSLDCHSEQRRPRHVQFGSCDGSRLAPRRFTRSGESQPPCMASEGKRRGKRSWQEFVTLQGLPAGFDLPSFTVLAAYKAVGNGVPLPLARELARSVRLRIHPPFTDSLCSCGCGRVTHPGQSLVTDACRQRVSRARRFGIETVYACEA
jgi:DNA (cytosine-5)-methyltransferase 1